MGGYEIHTGDMKNSAIAAGTNASAVAAAQSTRGVGDEVRAELDKLMELLAAHCTEVPDGDEVLELAAAVKDELAKERPKLGLARIMLNGIVKSVAGLDVLADAVTKVLQLIGHPAI